MSDEVSNDDEPDVTDAPVAQKAEGAEQPEPVADRDPAGEPQGAEVLLPRNSGLRIAWVVLAVFWVFATIAVFVQSCSPR